MEIVMQIIGILDSLGSDNLVLKKVIENYTIETIGKNKYYSGTIGTKKVVGVFSGWGKTSVAETTSTLIHRYNVTHIVMTGLAGALDKDLNIGDIIIGSSYIQHDLDLSPMFPRGVIPFLGKSFLECDKNLLEKAELSVKEVLDNDVEKLKDLQYFNTSDSQPPKYKIGEIATGDKFITKQNEIAHIKHDFPLSLAVDMDSATAAHLCYCYDIPFISVHTISDKADDTAQVIFKRFLADISSHYSIAFINNIINKL
jgi:adenosylhomocysteine nucleosidase